TDTREARALLTSIGSGQNIVSATDADDAIVRRMVEAAALPDLLERETATALADVAGAEASVVFVDRPGTEPQVVAWAACDMESARSLARSFAGQEAHSRPTVFVDALGRTDDGPRLALVVSPRPLGDTVLRRLRMIAAVARQGFALCAAR